MLISTVWPSGVPCSVASTVCSTILTDSGALVADARRPLPQGGRLHSSSSRVVGPHVQCEEWIRMDPHGSIPRIPPSVSEGAATWKLTAPIGPCRYSGNGGILPHTAATIWPVSIQRKTWLVCLSASQNVKIV